MTRRSPSPFDEKPRRDIGDVVTELERARAELDQFIYVASHDLTAPLRTVDGFVRLLAERYAGRLDEEADEFIAFALGGVRQMQGLIRDLLSYSRASAMECNLTPVDTAVLAAEAAAAVSDGDTVEFEGLPVVTADAALLRQVLRNLIDNAIKFVPAGQAPHVVVSAAEEADCWRFSVRDNGIGIAQADREVIFGLFRRLHGQDDYPGSGIGLPVCRRIVERHHGRIWAGANDGSGSVFHFTIGKGPVTA